VSDLPLVLSVALGVLRVRLVPVARLEESPVVAPRAAPVARVPPLEPEGALAERPPPPEPPDAVALPPPELPLPLPRFCAERGVPMASNPARSRMDTRFMTRSLLYSRKQPGCQTSIDVFSPVSRFNEHRRAAERPEPWARPSGFLDTPIAPSIESEVPLFA
jgi:hypothetical protein